MCAPISLRPRRSPPPLLNVPSGSPPHLCDTVARRIRTQPFNSCTSQPQPLPPSTRPSHGPLPFIPTHCFFLPFPAQPPSPPKLKLPHPLPHPIWTTTQSTSPTVFPTVPAPNIMSPFSSKTHQLTPNHNPPPTSSSPPPHPIKYYSIHKAYSPLLPTNSPCPHTLFRSHNNNKPRSPP